jgi:hypothetical protein
MDKTAGVTDEAVDSPYQQKWFPGVHGAVGGGERQGPVRPSANLDSRRRTTHGLEFDVESHSRIYEPLSNYADFLANSPLRTAKPH